jgi:hypothetical protein
MPLKCSVKAQVPREYMFFGAWSPNLRSILKPEVELMVFLRMRSDKITKNCEKSPSNAVLRPNFPHVYVFWYGESEFEVHLLTGSSILGFLRMRSDKITKNGEKSPSNAVLRLNFRVYPCFSVRRVRI